MTRAKTVRQGAGQDQPGAAIDHETLAGSTSDASDAAAQATAAPVAEPTGNGRVGARDDLLYENLELAFPRMRGFWREADPWTRGAYERMHRARHGDVGMSLLDLLLQPLLRRLYARSRRSPGTDTPAPPARSAPAQDGALVGEIERLSRAVQELEQSVTQIASRPMVVQGPARDVRFRHQPRQRSAEHSAVLKEIFETNLELRQTMHQPAQPSEQAA